MIRNIDYMNSKKSVLESIDPLRKITLKNRVRSMEMLPYQKYQMGKSMQKDYIIHAGRANVRKFNYTEYN